MGASSIELAPTLFVARRHAHQVELRPSSKRINQANAAYPKQALHPKQMLRSRRAQLSNQTPQPKQVLRRYLMQHL